MPASAPSSGPAACGGLSPAAYRPPASLYLHIPFCRAKCSYCDFSSYPLPAGWYGPYVEALLAEVRAAGAAWQRPPLETLYIGGGTPTALPSALLAQLLQAVRDAFAVRPGAEITCEANPGTVTAESLAALQQAGVNRLSLGVQSFQPHFLQLLGRIHSAAQAREAVALARRAGLQNVNLDLIYGLPGQALADWQSDLEDALALEPEHLSLYSLILEPGTPLEARVACRALPAPSPDLAADMYEFGQARLAEAGFTHYEISNWARPGLESRHNLTYWHDLPYAGCGAAAHSWLRGRRCANVARPEEYIARWRGGRPLTAEEECTTPALERAEVMILGLRLLAGVSRPEFRARFGADPTDLYAGAIAESVADGLLEVTAESIRLTPHGLLLGNQVFVRFLPDA